MRVMKAFEIEAAYQKHKQRLTSIQSLNTKKKAANSTTRNMEMINNYKKQKLTAEIFTEKEKAEQITKDNFYIQKNLAKVYNRDPRATGRDRASLQRINSTNSIRSANSESSRIKVENRKIAEKIGGMKSSYTKLRETKYGKGKSFTVGLGAKNHHREELVRLLEMQLGQKPQVLFPRVKKRVQKSNDKKGSHASLFNK